MYTLYKFHFLNGISEINQLFDDILIIWPAPVYIHMCMFVLYLYMQGRHALIIFEGARVGGGGVIMWHIAATTALMFYLFYFYLKHSQMHKLYHEISWFSPL